jgi:hypothetical protein
MVKLNSEKLGLCGSNILQCYIKREIQFLHKDYCVLQMFGCLCKFSVIADIILLKLKKDSFTKRDITHNMKCL